MKVFIKLILISIILNCLNYTKSYSQFPSEIALMASQTEKGGSARITGLGGASTAIGGEISSISSNPAGLGLYNRNEISISPSMLFTDSKTDYMGNKTHDFKTNFNFSNLGVVFNNSRDDVEPGAWRGGSFGISYNKNNYFHNKYSYYGNETQYDMVDYLVDEANGVMGNPDDFPTLPYLGWKSYLIDYDSVSGKYIRGQGVYFPTDTFPTYQRETTTTFGSQRGWNFAYGGNISDVFYFGLSLNFNSFYYSKETKYSESIIPGENDIELRDYTLTENFDVRGNGVAATFGIIARPVSPLLLGASFVTPTYYSISQDYEASITSNFTDQTFSEADNPSPYEYELRTPYRLNGGMTLFFGKSGFITGDVEYVDYSENILSSNGDDMEVDNNEILNFYTSTLNYRVGGELRADVFRLRAGFAHIGNPYVSTEDFNADASRTTFSGGFGVRTSDYYVDLGISNTRFSSTTYDAYPGSLPITRKDSYINAVLTFGLLF